MKIPEGMTEEDVLSSIDRVANGLAYKYKFGYYGVDDMKQEARLLAIEGLERYDSSRGKLETFLWTHVSNRLFNIKRNKYSRPDKPCFDCPLNAYDPDCKNSINQCLQSIPSSHRSRTSRSSCIDCFAAFRAAGLSSRHSRCSRAVFLQETPSR